MTGHNSIKMTELSVLYKNLGFNDSETFIQSGNVIFRSDATLSIPDIALKIENAIHEKFNYNVPVLIRTPDEMRKFISVNPFLSETDFNPAKMAVLLLYEEPLKSQIQKVININYPPDKFRIIGREIFIYCPNGFGRTKLYTNFFEKKMGVTGTARNWNTINTILSIAEQKYF